MGLLRKLFNKKEKISKEEKKKEFTKISLTEEQIEELEKEYKNNPHFIGLCRFDDCYSPIYKSDKYNTITDNNRKRVKLHTSCLRKMRKQAKKLLDSGLVPKH